MTSIILGLLSCVFSSVSGSTRIIVFTRRANGVA